MRRPIVSLGCLLSACLVLAGCGKDKSSQSGYVTGTPVKVTGKILFSDQKPVWFGKVMFLPTETKAKGRDAVGTLKPDGSFELGTYAADDGAIPGDYVVVIDMESEGQSLGAGKKAPPVPKEFQARSSTTFKATVPDGGASLPAFVLPTASNAYPRAANSDAGQGRDN